MVLDYESLRKDTQGCGRPIRVYASELIVPEAFVFPLHEAQVEKLALFQASSAIALTSCQGCSSFSGWRPRTEG